MAGVPVASSGFRPWPRPAIRAWRPRRRTEPHPVSGFPHLRKVRHRCELIPLSTNGNESIGCLRIVSQRLSQGANIIASDSPLRRRCPPTPHGAISSFVIKRLGFESGKSGRRRLSGSGGQRIFFAVQCSSLERLARTRSEFGTNDS